MEDWKQLFELIVELAFREGSRAVLWMVIGGVAGVVVSLLLLLGLFSYLKRRPFCSKSRLEKWPLRIFMILLAIGVVPLLAGGGVSWGLVVAAEKTVISEELIEKSSQEAFGYPIAQLASVLEEKVGGQESVDDAQDIDGEDAVDLLLIREQVNKAEESIYEAVTDHLLRESDEVLEKIPSWFRFIVKKMVEKFLEHPDRGFFFNQLDEVLDDAEERKGGAEVTANDLAWSVGAVYLVPEVKKMSQDFRSAILVGAVIQLVILLVIYLAIGAIVLFLLNKMFGSESESNG